MNDDEWLAEKFEENRPHLRAVAYRMLGSPSEADDAVQDTWIRVSRSDTEGVENLGGWLTTIVARVCLNMLRSRTTRREEPIDAHHHDPENPRDDGFDPERAALVADSVGPALLVVLDLLTPTERLAFVLHDMFAVPFDEIAPIVGRTPAATRQLASRARRRVQGAETEVDADRARERAVVDAFLAASRRGDFDALLALLDPDVVLRADAASLQAGAAEAAGAAAVAETFAGRAKAAQPALVDADVALVWAQGGVPRVVFALTILDGKIAEIDMVADPERIAELAITLNG